MATRAVRNNNPGNLWTGGKIIFPGQIGTDSGGFAIFNSYDAGAAAADSNLQSYAKAGIDTPYEIIYGNSNHGGWSTTDQATYANNLANSLGVRENQHVDLNNPDVRKNVLGAIFHQEDSNYKNDASPLSQSWDDIMKAAQSGNPLEFPFKVGAAIFNAAHGAMASAGNAAGGAVSGIGDTVSNAFNFDLGGWFSTQAKNYVIPVAIGLGALLLIMLSAWGLVKDTPIGQTIKTTGKTAAGLAFV